MTNRVQTDDTALKNAAAKATLVIRVGVTGHRDLPPAEFGRLAEQTDKVLRLLARVAGAIHRQRHEAGLQIYADDEPILRCISPLAEGGDRLVARHALACGFKLQCPLPFPREEYEKDFRASADKRKSDTTVEFQELLTQAEGGVLELDGTRADSKDAYEALGRLVLRQCDVLIAVWDEEHEEGREKTGGTRQIVRESLGMEIPTVWISSRIKREPCVLRSIEPLETEDLNCLDQRLRRMFLFSSNGDDEDEAKKQMAAETRRREITAADEFFAEPAPKRNYSFPFTFYRDFWCWGRQERQLLPDPDWQPLFVGNQGFKQDIEQAYNWADSLAKHYGGIFRSSYILSYLTGAFAVLFAFLGLYFRFLYEQPGFRYLPYFFFVPELLLIIAVSTLTWQGRRKRWHHRWMDYRLLAESLRQIQFLAPLGRTTPSFKVPAHLQPGDPRNSWFNWYFRALVRHGGMVQARFDSSHLRLCTQTLRDAVRKQIEYHENNSSRLETVARRSRRTGQGYFIVAGIACVLHLTGEDWQDTTIKFALSFATIILPVFGAALAAVSHHGEFERLAIRSEALAERLMSLLKKELTGAEPLSSKELGRAAETFSEIMLAEILDWRFALLEKNLDLPA